MLTRDAILKADDLPALLIHVPEWGGSVYVRPMTLLETMEREAAAKRVDGDGRKLALEIARIVCRQTFDAEGKRLFSDDDAERLLAKSGQAIARVFAAVKRAGEVDEAAVEGAEKNSRLTPSLNSS